MEILSIFAGLIVLLSVGILIYCIKDRFYEYLFVLILNVIMSFISIFLSEKCKNKQLDCNN